MEYLFPARGAYATLKPAFMSNRGDSYRRSVSRSGTTFQRSVSISAVASWRGMGGFVLAVGLCGTCGEVIEWFADG